MVLPSESSNHRFPLRENGERYNLNGITHNLLQPWISVSCENDVTFPSLGRYNEEWIGSLVNVKNVSATKPKGLILVTLFHSRSKI